MKSNEAIGFESLYGTEGCYSGGNKGSVVVVEYYRPYTLTVTMGKKASKYRVFAYLYEWNQDASREGIRDRTCGRGDTPQEAIDQWRDNAIRTGWTERFVDRAAIELREDLLEHDIEV